ncbi:MAG: hypothetical protein ACRCVN_03130 [Spirochaetia bacterium]
MKKSILLLCILVLSVSKISAFDFAMGGLVYGQFNTESPTLGAGLSLGFGGKRSNTFILNLLVGTNDMGIFTGTQQGWMDMRATLDWHLLALNLTIIQIYLGVGVGGQMGFNVEKDKNPFQHDENPLSFTLFARLPIGVKVFLGSLELFFELTPEVGWENTSFERLDTKISKDNLFWAFTAGTGLRIWF